MGGDGIFDPAYIKLAGKTSDGDLATSVGAPTETLDSAKPFVDDYAAGGFKQPYDAYGAYAYDAANAIINGLKISLASAADAKSARQATINAIGERVLRRRHRPGRLRRVRRHEHQGADRLQGEGGKWGRQDRQLDRNGRTAAPPVRPLHFLLRSRGGRRRARCLLGFSGAGRVPACTTHHLRKGATGGRSCSS